MTAEGVPASRGALKIRGRVYGRVENENRDWAVVYVTRLTKTAEFNTAAGNTLHSADNDD